jgi:diguanylate cyclase (GGDEF)-like protein/PAS domain S-box-containing protein
MNPFDRPQVQQDAWFLRALADSPAAVFATDKTGIVRRWSAGAEALFGWHRHEVVGRTLADIQLVSDPVRQRRADDVMRKVLSGEPWTGEWTARRRDGSPVAVSTVHQPLRDENGEVVGFVSVAFDLSDRDRFEAALLREAMHDPLTGLPNRTLLLDQLHRTVGDPNRAGSAAVLFIDLDRFKRVNDAHGHLTGDAVLIEVAQRLRAAVREGDMVGRLGGDEFVILCRFGASPAGIIDIANRVSELLRRPVHVKGVTVAMGASVGIALAEPGADAEALLDRADAAMYRAKGKGSGEGGVVVLAENLGADQVWLTL